MQLRDLLLRRHILVPLRASSVREAMDALVDTLSGSDAVSDPDALDAAVRKRTLREVVAIGDSVALPHFRTDAVDRLLIAIGVAPASLDTAGTALDHPPRIVILILAPLDAATLYLQTVAALARLLRGHDVVHRILEAESPDDILLMPEFRETKIQPELTVRDVMTQGAVSATPETPIRSAADLMMRRHLRVVPVVGEKHEVLGLVSDREVMRGLLPQIPRSSEEATEEAAAPRELAVRDVMSRSVLCIAEEMGITEAASMMINKDVELFPVVSEGKLVGLLTREDIIRKLFGQ